MSKKYLEYLTREHERLESELEAASGQRFRDQMLIARLKKLKLAVRDEIAANERIIRVEQAA